jgi:U1 zinc finger
MRSRAPRLRCFWHSCGGGFGEEESLGKERDSARRAFPEKSASANITNLLSRCQCPPHETFSSLSLNVTGPFPRPDQLSYCSSSFGEPTALKPSSKMPKFFCDYCDVYLTHDSMSVRKAHNSGRNHLRNVVEYYQRMLSRGAFCNS